VLELDGRQVQLLQFSPFC